MTAVMASILKEKSSRGRSPGQVPTVEKLLQSMQFTLKFSHLLYGGHDGRHFEKCSKMLAKLSIYCGQNLCRNT